MGIEGTVLSKNTEDMWGRKQGVPVVECQGNEPQTERTADADDQREPPDFDALASPEEAVHGDRTRDNCFDAVLGLDSPRWRVKLPISRAMG
ncbi:hypothetical protein HYG82_21015 [Natrinema halophilum]|nr:hypothetical protein [Natrinema halophilum]UHQ96065.1 hypothetical protein HYG82_21015 [Natrinema halophilum]